jgi:serine/threonine protein kinase
VTAPPETPPPPPAEQKLAIQPNPGEIIVTAVTGHRYTIGRRLGEGSFGIVYECVDEWENDLAVKVLKPIGTYEKVRDAADAEFRKLVLLRHPNITFVHDLFEYRNAFYIVTERCHLSLSDMLQRPSFQGQLWLRAISRCVLQAVSFLHFNRYVHQDIHPGNVFAAFVKDEVLPPPATQEVLKFKLGDLGVTRLLEEVDAKNTRAQWMLPPEVMSPEFGPIDQRLDIYHLGLLFLQLASSREMRFTAQEILDGKPRHEALLLPAPYNFALEKALRRHAKHRTTTAGELWRDLQSPAQQTEPPTDVAPAPPDTGPATPA